MAKRDKDRGYEVGYGRPPTATRFKKGQSGNPKGRPKATSDVASILNDTFFRKITITENGVRREVTVLEAILRQLAHSALKGETRQLDRVLRLLPTLQENQAAAEANLANTPANDPQADRAVLEALAEMFGSDPANLFASAHGDMNHEGADT